MQDDNLFGVGNTFSGAVASPITKVEIEQAIDEINDAYPARKHFDLRTKERITKKLFGMKLKKNTSTLIVGPHSADFLPIVLTKLGIKVSTIDTDSSEIEAQIRRYKRFGLDDKISVFTSYNDIGNQNFDYVFMLAVMSYIVDTKDRVIEQFHRMIMQGILLNKTLPKYNEYLREKAKEMLHPIVKRLNPNGGFLFISDPSGVAETLPNPNLILEILGGELGFEVEKRPDIDVDDFSMHISHLDEFRTGGAYFIKHE